MNQTLLEERASGIGGSDVHHLFNIEPYGCCRRLWYDKTGTVPDYPPQTTGPMRRGTLLEDLVAQEYELATGRAIQKHGVVHHPLHPELLVHVDRLIFAAERQHFGVLEIKTLQRETFAKVKREGMQQGHILQVQHAMLVTAAGWGGFAVLHPDSWSLLWWDVDRDEEIISAIRDKAVAFWPTVENGPAPERLEAKDRRCSGCPWRRSCQGEALLGLIGEKDAGDIQTDDSLAGLVDEYREARQLEDDAAELTTGIRARLETAIGQRTAIQTVGARVYWRPQVSHRIDAAGLRQKYPEIAKEFDREILSRPLRVYPI